MSQPTKNNYCRWCGVITSNYPSYIPSSPILEWLEEKIDILGREKVWDENSDWSKIEMDTETEAELLVYEGMLNTIIKGRVCDECLKKDDELFEKYYGPLEQGEDIFFDDDF